MIFWDVTFVLFVVIVARLFELLINHTLGLYTRMVVGL
jgi:hypothetical protein